MNAQKVPPPSQVGWFIANPTLHNPLGPLSTWYITVSYAESIFEVKTGLVKGNPSLLGGSLMRYGGGGGGVDIIEENVLEVIN